MFLKNMFRQAFRDQRGVAAWIIIAIIAAIAIIVIASEAAQEANDDDSDDEQNRCPTYCIAFLEFQCGSNRLIDGCIGVWDCSAGVTEECQ